MDDHFDPLGDEEKAEQARKDAGHTLRVAEQVEKDDLRWLLSTRRGRRVLARILDSTGEALPSFDTSASAMAFKEGRRHVAIELKRKLKRLAPENYYLMLQENNL